MNIIEKYNETYMKYEEFLTPFQLLMLLKTAEKIVGDTFPSPDRSKASEVLAVFGDQCHQAALRGD